MPQIADLWETHLCCSFNHTSFAVLWISSDFFVYLKAGCYFCYQSLAFFKFSHCGRKHSSAQCSASLNTCSHHLLTPSHQRVLNTESDMIRKSSAYDFYSCMSEWDFHSTSDRHTLDSTHLVACTITQQQHFGSEGFLNVVLKYITYERWCFIMSKMSHCPGSEWSALAVVEEAPITSPDLVFLTTRGELSTVFQ